jgi:hypothetical protein
MFDFFEGRRFGEGSEGERRPAYCRSSGSVCSGGSFPPGRGDRGNRGGRGHAHGKEKHHEGHSRSWLAADARRVPVCAAVVGFSA